MANADFLDDKDRLVIVELLGVAANGCKGSTV
jgi:hypothetical protein